MPSAPGRAHQRGFTLIEVMVAITILLVGVLGVVAMVDGANAVTSKTKAREGANSVARSIVEVGRAVPYKNLTAAELVDALQGRPGLGDVAPGGVHTIASRGFDYDVTLQVCSMDDPRDNLGAHDGTIEFCPDSDVGSGVGTNVDRNPDDYKRIAVTLTWQRRGSTETVKQTSLVSNPVGGLGPTVIKLEPQGVTGTPKTVTSEGTVTFDVETNTNAIALEWSVDGAFMGRATPVGTTERAFTFTWDIEGASGGTYYVDGTYVVQAQAFDDKGRSGSPKALTVVLNRARPIEPAQFQGGRNGNGDRVDLTWKANPERDVLGYRVYRSTTAGGPTGGPWTLVTCFDQSLSYHEETSCLDEGADATNPLYYYVVGVDTQPGTTTPRDSNLASYLTVGPGNTRPTAPTGLTACLGGIPGCTEPNGDPAPDGATVIRWNDSTDPDPLDSILFYRIYRDGDPVSGPTYAQRYGIFFPVGGGALAWTDPNTPSGPHTYHLTAVASNFGESLPSAPVVSFP
ncbi:MAG TPA: prepilin-type N-terminal cleavage/methylation domain-containing protein [Nitriliruptorales bacterium]|nr:prepilin-type N-terminal cleavage/methylation domain-containing protein [Nitriliruptorales bacterium]